MRQKISTKKPFFAAQDHYTSAKEREALLTHRDAQTARYTRKKSLTRPPKDLYTSAKEREALLTRKEAQKSRYTRKKSLTRPQKRKATLMHGYPQKIPAKDTRKRALYTFKRALYISQKRETRLEYGSPE